MDANDTMIGNIGISRRSLLKRSAVVGGTVWAVPVIQSMSAPAFAQAVTYGGGRTDLSYIALIYDCGAGPRGIKVEVPEGCQDANMTSGCDLLLDCESETGQTPDCGDFFGDTPDGSCADISSAVVDNNGNATIVLNSGCTILEVAAKCGSGPGSCAQTPNSPHIAVNGNRVTVSDNFCPNPVGE